MEQFKQQEPKIISRREALRSLAISAGAASAGILAASCALGDDPSPASLDNQATGKVPAIGSVRMDPLVPLVAVPGDFAPAFADASQTGRSWAEVSWNEAINKVSWQVHYDKLPYRPTVTRPPNTNPSSQSGSFVPNYPEVVVDAAYQFWMISMNPLLQTCYYDKNTLDFMGTTRTLNPLPAIDEAIVTNEPELVLACSPLAEPDPVTGEMNFSWEVAYDKVIDAAGNGGFVQVYTPMNLKNAGERAPVVTVLPPEEAFPFSFFHQGAGLALDTTIEPNPKPADLTSSFNPMVVQGQIANFPLPPGFTVDVSVTNQIYPLPALPYVHPLIRGVQAC